MADNKLENLALNTIGFVYGVTVHRRGFWNIIKRIHRKYNNGYEGVCDNNALVRPPLFRADGYFIRREKKIPFLYLIEVENHSKLTAEKLHWYAEIFDDFCTSETSWEFRVIVTDRYGLNVRPLQLSVVWQNLVCGIDYVK